MVQQSIESQVHPERRVVTTERRGRQCRGTTWGPRHHLHVFFLLLLLVCFAGLAGGCDVTLDVVADENFEGRFDRLYIVLAETPGVEDKLYEKLSDSLGDELDARGNTGDVLIKPALMLDEADFVRELASYQPEGTLIMRLIAQTVDEYGGIYDVTWDACLTPPTRDDCIWRAHITDTTLKMGFTQRKIAEKLFEEFEARGYVGEAVEVPHGSEGSRANN